MKGNGYVFLNGRIVDASRATVSVYDRGLLYGDGLFETMRAYKGVAFAIEEHFHRLRTSADILGLPIPNLDWPATIAALLEKNGLARQDAWVRLTITRGPAEPRVLPPDLPKPTTIMMVRPLDRDIAVHQKRGVKVALLPFSRHGFIPEHKSLNYLPAVVGKVLASYHGAYEGIFVRSDHVLTEGTTTSVFIVRDGMLWTAPEGGILPGVTRAPGDRPGARQRHARRRARDHHHRSAPGRRGVPHLVDDRDRAHRPRRRGPARQGPAGADDGEAAEALPGGGEGLREEREQVTLRRLAAALECGSLLPLWGGRGDWVKPDPAQPTPKRRRAAALQSAAPSGRSR